MDSCRTRLTGKEWNILHVFLLQTNQTSRYAFPDTLSISSGFDLPSSDIPLITDFMMLGAGEEHLLPQPVDEWRGVSTVRKTA